MERKSTKCSSTSCSVFLSSSLNLLHTVKGGLISLWLQSPKKRLQITALKNSTWRKDAQSSDLAPFFGDWSQSEKLSEIKPPLVEPNALGQKRFLIGNCMVLQRKLHVFLEIDRLFFFCFLLAIKHHQTKGRLANDG